MIVRRRTDRSGIEISGYPKRSNSGNHNIYTGTIEGEQCRVMVCSSDRGDFVAVNLPDVASLSKNDYLIASNKKTDIYKCGKPVEFNLKPHKFRSAWDEEIEVDYALVEVVQADLQSKLPFSEGEEFFHRWLEVARSRGWKLENPTINTLITHCVKNGIKFTIHPDGRLELA